MIWEEHRYYYTKHTLIGELRNLGFEIVLFKRILIHKKITYVYY